MKYCDALIDTFHCKVWYKCDRNGMRVLESMLIFSEGQKVPLGSFPGCTDQETFEICPNLDFYMYSTMEDINTKLIYHCAAVHH